jgi:transcriptional regulator with XRE-family HTH domain
MVDDLRARGGLGGSDLATIAQVTPGTVARWAAGKAMPHPRTKQDISDLWCVVDRLAKFYEPEETRIWLYARHPLLDGSCAVELIQAGALDRVLGVIDRLAEASFT